MDKPDVAILMRKMLLYFGIWLVGYLGMLYFSGHGSYRQFVLFNAIAVSGLVGYLFTPAWESLKHDAGIC